MGRIDHEVEHYVPYLNVGVDEVTSFVSTGPLMPVVPAGSVVCAAVTHPTAEDAEVYPGKPRRVRIRARARPGETTSRDQ